MTMHIYARFLLVYLKEIGRIYIYVVKTKMRISMCVHAQIYTRAFMFICIILSAFK